MNFNARFLLDAVSHVKSDVIRMALPDTYGAVLIGEEDGEYLNVIMPVKV